MAAAAAAPAYRPPWLQRIGSTTSTLRIENLVNHRRYLHDVFVNATASGYVDISVGNTTWLRIYHNLAQAKLMGDLEYRAGEYGFLWWLAHRIPDFPRINASQDEDIIITASATPTRMDAYFEDVEVGDVTSRTLPGGSQSSRHLFILNMSNSAAVTASGRYRIDRLDMPTGATIFSDGTRMAANIRFTCYMIAGNFPKAGSSKTTRVHIVDEFTELFTSENREGLHVDPDNGNELAFNLSPPKTFWLPQPYVFEPNHLLVFEGEASHDGVNNLAAGSQQLFLVGIREFLAGV
ncbi:MAG: hypothetical protein QXE52_08265 [Candidatus Caldarchaeum sp.]